jgi:xylulokinase
VPVELYESDGSVGAALGAGIGAKIFSNAKEAFTKMKPLQLVQPTKANEYNELYEKWEKLLSQALE